MSVSLNGERGRTGPLPAAPACGLAVTWLAEGEDRAGWSQPSAPGTTAPSLAWRGEACRSQTGTGEHAEERKKERRNRKIQEKTRVD